MKKALLFCIALSMLSVSIAGVKRSAPQEVAPIKSGGTEYRAPHGQMGCVEAGDTDRNELN
jgi:hypothetical protein